MGSVGKSTGNAFDYEKFSNRLDSYIGGGYQIAGPGGAFSEADIKYIQDHMKSTGPHVSMFRVEDNDWTAKDLKVGDTIEFNNDFKSFTKSVKSTTRILDEMQEWDVYETPVVFRTQGKQKYFDVQSEAKKIGNSAYDYQEETFMKGKGWKIKRISKEKFGSRTVKVVTIG